MLCSGFLFCLLNNACAHIYALWDSRQKVACLLQCCITTLNWAENFLTEGGLRTCPHHYFLSTCMHVLTFNGHWLLQLWILREAVMSCRERETRWKIFLCLEEKVITLQEEEVQTFSLTSLAWHPHLYCCSAFELLDGTLSISINLPQQTERVKSNRKRKDLSKLGRALHNGRGRGFVSKLMRRLCAIW